MVFKSFITKYMVKRLIFLKKYEAIRKIAIGGAGLLEKCYTASTLMS